MNQTTETKKRVYIGRESKRQEANNYEQEIKQKNKNKQNPDRWNNTSGLQKNPCRAPPSVHYRVPSAGGNATDSSTNNKRKKTYET